VLPISTDLAEQFAWGRSRFLEEANTLKKLEGTPSIVSVHDFLEANGTAYMVMALIEGETLAKRLIREERLAAAVIEPLLFPLLDGLEKVHDEGFLHRDIKPANIMVDSEGKPTLIDFGASRAALAGRSTTFTSIFTPGYAAAEQFASKKLGPWTDIYGLAATLYHAITGKSPPSAIERVFADEYQPLIDLQPAGYSVGFLEGIDAAMAVSSADRPQSIAEWRRMLASSLDATRIARSPGRLARAASRTRRARVNMGVPVIGLAGAVVIAVLGAAGYFGFATNTPAPVPPTASTAALVLSAEELEQALAERRRADALAADKRRQEEEARQKAEADAETKRLADAELERVRQARQEAEQKVAVLKAGSHGEEVAQRRAEAEVAALRQTEQEARKHAEAEAEAKRQADEALVKVEAERRQAEEAARGKAEAEQSALRQASEGAQRKAAEAESVKQAEQERLKAEAERAKAEADRQKAEAELKLRAEAEAAEKTLRLDQPARERLQLALTSLGFDTRGSDGIFGPRSREMISAWQKARNQPMTGFLNTAQQQALLKEAAPALAKLDEAKKSEEEAKTRPQTTAPLATAAVATSPVQPPPTSGASPPGSTTKYDGAYTSNTNVGGYSGSASRVIMSLQIVNGRGTGTLASPGCSSSPFSVVVSDTGNVSGEGVLNCVIGGMTPITGPLTISGSMQNVLVFAAPRGGAFRVRPERGHAAAASTPAPASPDGLWRGTYACTAVGGTRSYTIDLNLTLAKGTSSGGGVLPSVSNDYTMNIEVSVDPPHVTITRTAHSGGTNPASVRSSLRGQFDGNSIRASGRQTTNVSQRGDHECVVTLSRAP